MKFELKYKDFFPKCFDNIVSNMFPILFWPQCVKHKGRDTRKFQIRNQQKETSDFSASVNPIAGGMMRCVQSLLLSFFLSIHGNYYDAAFPASSPAGTSVVAAASAAAGKSVCMLTGAGAGPAAEACGGVAVETGGGSEMLGMAGGDGSVLASDPGSGGMLGMAEMGIDGGTPETEKKSA